MKFLGVLAFSFMIHTALLAQQFKRIGVEGTYGWIIPHSGDLIPISQTNPFGTQFSYQWMKTDFDTWSVCNCFHYIGIQLSHHQFGNPQVLGSATSLSTTLEPILLRGNRFVLSLGTGIGLSYLSKVYDEQSNPENIFFSSPLSFLLSVSPKLEYQLSDNWAIQASIHYHHISNAGQSQPNKGMNYPMIGLGMNHYLNRQPFPIYEKSLKNRDLQTYMESGFNTRFNSELGRRVVNLAIMVGVKKPVSNINGIGAGMEVMKSFGAFEGVDAWQALRPSPFLSHHFLFGRVDFSQQLAVYLSKPNEYINSPIYQRYTLRYLLGSNLYMGFSLKAHAQVAEQLDFRLGWNF